MATLAALLKSRGHDVRGSDQNVYPPMSDFLAAEGIPTFTGYSRRPHHRRHRPGGGRQCDLARQPGARDGARAEDPVLLAARGDSRPLPVGRPLDRPGRHARQDDDDVADRVAADAWRPRSDDAGRRHRAQFRRRRIELPRRRRAATSSSKATNTTARSSTRRRSSSSTCPTSPSSTTSSSITPTSTRISTRSDWRSAGSCELVPRNGLLLLGADSPHAAALVPTGGQPGRDVRARTKRRRGRRSTIEHRDGLTRFDVRRDGDAVRTIRVATARRAQRAQRAGGDCRRRPRRHRRRRRWPKGCGSSRASSGGSRPSAWPRRHGARRLRAPSDGGPRDAGRAAHRLSRRAASGRCSSRGRPRRAGASSRTTSPRRSAPPTKWWSRRCSGRRCPRRSGCPPSSWWTICARRAGTPAHIPEIDDIVATIVREHRDGDVVVLMSNGGFGGIHGKLLQALSRERRAARFARPAIRRCCWSCDDGHRRLDVNARAIAIAAAVRARGTARRPRRRVHVPHRSPSISIRSSTDVDAGRDTLLDAAATRASRCLAGRRRSRCR